MPRKQRFKPSRKPKPIPQTESGSVGDSARSTSSTNGTQSDRSDTASSMHKGEDSSLQPGTDHQR